MYDDVCEVGRKESEHTPSTSGQVNGRIKDGGAYWTRKNSSLNKKENDILQYINPGIMVK